MVSGLRLGLKHSASLTVTEDLTVPQVSPALGAFADMPPVFATAFMVGFIEGTCIECVRTHLGEGQLTVGTHVDVSHTAPTPVGMTVTATVELTSVQGGQLGFEVEVRDEVGPVGSGTHQRAIIDVDRFMRNVRSKGGES